MRKPDRIRYYITNNGEESTVRSVRVALGVSEQRVECETNPAALDATLGEQSAPASETEVKRRVKDAIRRTVDR